MEGKQNPSTTDNMSLKKYVFLSLCLRIICLLLNQFVLLLLCLQNPCSSVLYKSLTPLGAPLSVGEGLGVRLYHRERENQINTLVLKDINFTINIIELSYYRTIDTLNQSLKMLPWHLYVEAEPVIRNVLLYHSA